VYNRGGIKGLGVLKQDGVGMRPARIVGR